MPLSSFREIDDTTCLGLWEITESEDLLLHQLELLAPADLVIPVYQNAGRQRQWLASRVLTYTLLHKLTAALPVLTANAFGKPVLENSAFNVSISHTSDMAAVILSGKYEVGIDIENIHPKVLRVRSKFLSDKELETAGDTPEKVMIYWCAKEALYKLYSNGQVLFKEHLFIEPFNFTDSGILSGLINMPGFKKKYSLPFEKHSSFILTYCIDTTPDLP